MRACPPMKKGWILLLKPALALSAAQVYGWYEEAQAGADEGLRPAGETRGNDLESVVFTRYPRFRRLCGELRSRGAGQVQMSGSGPTIFAVFPRRKEALEAARGFSRRRGWRADLARPLQEPALRSACLRVWEKGGCPVDRFP